jgi:hypothetical protein
MNFAARLLERLTITAALAFLCGALFVASHVEAQQTPDDALTATVDDAAPLSIDDDSLLSSINTESDWATALYVTSVSSMLVGAAVVVPTFFTALGCFDCRGDRVTVVNVVLAASFVTFAAGLLALPFAIALDVDSGSRRGGVSRTTVRLVPTALGLSLEGTF